MSNFEVLVLSDDDEDSQDVFVKDNVATVRKNPAASWLSSLHNDGFDAAPIKNDRNSAGPSGITNVSSSAGYSAANKIPSHQSSSSYHSNPFAEGASESEDEFDQILFGPKPPKPATQAYKPPSPQIKGSYYSDMDCSPNLDQDVLSQNPVKNLHPMSDSDSGPDPQPSKGKKQKLAPKNGNAVTKGSNGTKDSPKKVRKGKFSAEEKAAMEEEKLLKRRQKEEMRRKNPENCLKFIIMEVDQGLVDVEALQVVLLAPPINEIRNEVKRSRVSSSVCWHRERMPDENGDCERDLTTTMVQLLEMPKLESLIRDKLFASHVKNILKSNKTIDRFTMIVFGSKQYFSIKKKKNDGRITKDELEETIAECQIDLGISFRLLENAQEVSEWLFRYTKAIAQEPYKKMKRTWQDNFRFHLASEKSANIRDAFPSIWVKTLKKFRRAPMETCRAIADKYPSPTSLLLAYGKCDSFLEAQYLLENITVHKGVGPLATQRRVGPALSRRIHAVLTSVQPDQLLSELE